MKETEGESMQNEKANTHLRVHMVPPAVYDGPQETTCSWNLHCKYAIYFTYLFSNIPFNFPAVCL